MSAIMSGSVRRVHQKSEALQSRSEHDTNMSATSPHGVVDKLYTWGAPAPTQGHYLKNAKSSDGCWQGLRVVNLESIGFGTWYVDVVNLATKLFGYWHTRQPTVKIDQNGKSFTFPCGNDASNGVEFPAVSLHMKSAYTGKANSLDREAGLMTNLCVEPSYEQVPTAARSIRKYGWNLVGSSLWQNKETHLMQDPKTLDCVLTFQGSTADRVLDWWDNFRIDSTDFCGLENKVHRGWAGQLRSVVGHPQFREHIRPKLGKCRSVILAGHSQGGAMASLFAACVNNAPSGNNGDFKRMSWTKEAPAKLQPIA